MTGAGDLPEGAPAPSRAPSLRPPQLPPPPALGRPSPAASRPARLRPGGDSSRPCHSADGGDDGPWALRAASVAGVRHRVTGREVEDAYAWQLAGSAVVVAVADGVGSVPGSGGAARRAVSAACAAAAATLFAAPRSAAGTLEPAGLDRGGKDAGQGPQADRREPGDREPGDREAHLRGPLEPDGGGGAAACRDALAAAGEAVAAGPGATTLAVVVVDEGGACSLARVGDSSAFVLAGGTWRELFDEGPDDGVASSATAALPVGASRVEQSEVVLGPGEALVVVTDGVGDPLRDGPTTVAPALAGALATPPSPLGLAWAIDFSRQGCHDDRTLVALWRLPGPGA